VLISVCL